VVAMDLRGHSRSGWDPPWTIESHVDDLIETVEALGLTAVDWVGHSFGGRLVIELAVRRPDLIQRAVLLDPAIHFSGAQADSAVAAERREPIWDSAAECFASRDDAAGADEARALADLALQLEVLPDGRLRRRTSQEAVQAIFRQLVQEPPSPNLVPMPTMLLYAPEYGLVSQEQAHAYGRDGVVAVSGGHMVMWSAFDQVAETVASSFGHE
jgi:lipase